MHSFDPPHAHNDVKPGNVLITHRKGQPPLAILMDFGSARPARKQISSRSEALQLQVLLSSHFFTKCCLLIKIVYRFNDLALTGNFFNTVQNMWCVKVYHILECFRGFCSICSV